MSDQQLVPPYPSDDTPAAYTLPALRTRGLSVAQVDRAVDLHATIGRSGQLNDHLSTGDVTHADAALNAEDLVRGHAVDVWDDVTGKWHSLCRRVGTYTVPGTKQTFQVTDEAPITPAATGPSDLAPADARTADLYLHESMFHWTGWSLVAPRPGKLIPETGAPADPTPPIGSSPVAVSFAAEPGSLPPLRYGRTYRFRMRALDLAGNDISGGDLDPNDFSSATPPAVHQRFDPVAAPVLLLTAPRGPGEGTEEIVVRSNYDSILSAPSARYVAAPKMSQQMAEEHGMFDAGGKLSPGAYAMIAQRDPGTFSTLGVADPAGQDQRYFPLPPLDVPYLPDVLSRGAAFANLPGTSDVLTAPFSGLLGLPGWPSAPLFTLSLVEGEPASHWDPLLRVLTVSLPKGRQQAVSYSSYVNAADLPILGIWGWISEVGLSASDLAALRTVVTTGQHWMITPNRTVTLTHAVRQPVRPATFTNPVITRLPGKTYANIGDTLNFDRPSSAKVDLLANWTEPTDDPSTPAPTYPTLGAHVTQLSADYADAAGNTIALAAQQELRDTKYRRIGYHLVATSRYAEYFAQTEQITFQDTDPVVLSPAGVVPQTDRVASVPAGTIYRQGTDYAIDYPSGRLSIVAGGNLAVGATVDVRFVAPPITRDSTEVTPPTMLNVPASARPAAPQVRYVIPAFGWSSAAGGSLTTPNLTSQRQGGGLRVYLDRPWYSSGDGEQLGVVLWTGANDPDGTAKGLYSEWGADPVWSSAAVPTTRPTAAAFPLTTQPATGLTLAELPTQPNFGVAPHTVAYDASRQLWYADLQVNAGTSYFPFVRLALARYQANALTGCELSGVTLADFVQLAPDRAATVSWSLLSPQKLQVSVSGAGSTNAVAGATDAGGPTVLVSVQQFNPAYPGDLAWQPVNGTTDVTLTASPNGSDGYVWNGAVTLPGSRLLNRYRLVIREYEQYQADPAGNDIRVSNSLSGTKGQRLTYLDTIDL
jgi:hypothetical protein